MDPLLKENLRPRAYPLQGADLPPRINPLPGGVLPLIINYVLRDPRPSVDPLPGVFLTLDPILIPRQEMNTLMGINDEPDEWRHAMMAWNGNIKKP